MTSITPLILLVLLIISEPFAPGESFSLFDSFALYNNITGLFLNVLKDGIKDEKVSSDSSVDKSISEDAALLTPQLITKYGYPSEIHSVETVDGYILEIHRIPKKGDARAPAVLLMHGILDTSATWILMGPKSGLGYILSDSGYDIWMGNVRGNRYSKKHVNMTTEDTHFWDFSFHEMGVYDLSAIIDYILKEAGREKIHYVGHSQGTTMFWIMCSEKPEYSQKILSMHALAPVAFLSEMWNPFVKALTFGMDFLDAAANFFNINQLLPNTEIMVLSAQQACRDKAATQEVCSNVLFLIAGFNSKQMNKTMLPVILSHTPSGASTKQFMHFGQMIRSGYFRKFNYGYIRNLHRYGKFTPPDYNLNNVKVPVALYCGKNDWLVSVRSVNELNRKLPNVIDHYLVNDSSFNHLDFLWAVDVKQLLYDRIIENMKKIDERSI